MIEKCDDINHWLHILMRKQSLTSYNVYDAYDNYNRKIISKEIKI